MAVSAGHFELINGSTVVPLTLWAPRLKDGFSPDPEALRTFDEALVSSRSDTKASEWLEVEPTPNLADGFGVGCSASPGVDTYSSPGYALPAGAATNVVVNAVQNSVSPIVKMIDFGGDVWIAQRGSGALNSARVMRSASGTGNPSNSLNLGANEYMRDLLVFDNGAGVKVLWASSTDVNGASGRMHKWDGATWTSTAAALFGTNGRNRMASVFWRDEDGIGADRIFVVSSNQGHISYLKPYADPMLALSWVEGVRTGTNEPQPELAAARGHVWISARDGLFDINEMGDSPDLTSYTEKHVGGGLAALYHDGYVYRSAGSVLDRVRVDQNGVLQENPGVCSPGYLTKTKSPWAVGYTTALAEYQGVLAAQYCPSLGLPGIFWGKDKLAWQKPDGTGVDTANPLVWHGPIAHSSAAEVVTTMHITSVVPTVSRLYIATWNVSQLAAPLLTWISLPALGGAVAGLTAASEHRYATGVAGATNWQPYARLESLPIDGGSKASIKDLYQIIYGTEGLPASAPGGTDPSLAVYTRGDPLPSSVAWGSSQTVTLGPTATTTPSTTRGQKLEYRIDFISPNGAATPPKPAILDSIELLFWRTAPDLETYSIDVEYGPGVLWLNNSDMMADGRDVDWFDDALIAASRAGRVVFRVTEDRLRSVKIQHKLDRGVIVTPHGLIKRATLVIADLGVAA